MADFLNRVVERTLGLSAVVQPSVAPLFATERLPEAPEVLALLHEQEPVPKGDGLEVSETHTPAPSVLEPPAAPDHEPASARNAEGIADQAAQPVTPPPSTVRPHGRRQTASPMIPEGPQASIASAQDPPLSPLTALQTTSVTRYPTPLVSLLAHGDARVAAQSARSGASHPDEIPPANAPLVSSRAAAVGSLPQPMAAGNRRQFTGEDKEPTVHVTIGRIDVRAVLPNPPPARATARPEPQLTIEEYSRQRREGLR